MRLTVFIPILLGISTVLQGTINRRVAMQWTLPGAAMINAIVMACAAAVVFGLAVHHAGSVAALRHEAEPLSWWIVIPGVLGLAIVIGIPWTLRELGALAAFALIIASQLVASAAWDAFVEGKPLGWTRVLGGALTFAGALLATWRR